MINQELIDYEKCREYARILCGSFGIPVCNFEDIGSDAYLLSIRRSWHAEPEDNEEAVAKRLMYTSTVDIIRRRNTRAARTLSDAESLYRTTSDDGGPSDDDVIEERFAACEKGDAEERITEYLDWQNPKWLQIFESERQKLRNEKRKTAVRFVKEGLKDSRLSIVRANCKFSWVDFQTILQFLKMRFALCFQALRAFRDEN